MAEKKRILIIEDDEGVRDLLQRAFSFTYEVEVIADGLAAMRRVDKEPVANVIICDVMLPGADGLAVARRAKASKLWTQVPIIFLTARTTPRDVILGIQSGARHYVTKPFKLQELLGKVNKLAGV
jgi:DNA-binding response OmpR family regulator